MSRKSSVIVESELATECPHIRVTASSGGGRSDSRKNSVASGQQRHSLGDSGGVIHLEYEAILARAASNKLKKEPKIMTSFEKLAQMNDTFYFGGTATAEEEAVTSRQQKRQSDDEAFSYSFQAMRTSGGVVDPVRGGKGRDQPSAAGGDRDMARAGIGLREGNKCTSDYNIQYKLKGESKLMANGNGTGEGTTERSGGVGGVREHSMATVGGGDVKEMMKNKKQYDRFFTPDESEEEDDELVVVVIDNGKGKGKRATAAKRTNLPEENSSSPSSSSGGGGGAKSLLTTPVTETQPLLMTESDSGMQLYSKFQHSRGVSGAGGGGGGGRRKMVKHLTTDEEEDGYDDDAETTDYDRYGESVENRGSGGDRGPSGETPVSSPTSSYPGGGGRPEKMIRRADNSYYAHRSSSYIPIAEDFDLSPERVTANRRPQSAVDGSGPGNTIRIRVNEKSK